MIQDQHGIHWWCCQNFANVKCITAEKCQCTDEGNGGQATTSKRRRSGTSTILFPSDSCLFCPNERKWIPCKNNKLGHNETLVKCVTKPADSTIKEAASRKNDERLTREVNWVDLLAREACYHDTCSREYTRCVGPQKPHTQSTEDAKRLEAHRQVFAYICEYVEKRMIQGLHVERMTMLRERYLSFLQMHSPEYYNADYKTDEFKV